jgi:hypothetical protein
MQKDGLIGIGAQSVSQPSDEILKNSFICPIQHQPTGFVMEMQFED